MTEDPQATLQENAHVRAPHPDDISHPNPVDEASLVPLLVAIRGGGDARDAAMSSLLDLVQRPVHAFVRRRAERFGFDDALVDDVVQETLVAVLLHAHRCTAATDQEAIGWVLAIARSAWSDVVRREGPHAVPLDDPCVDRERSMTLGDSAGRRAAAAPGPETLLRAVVEASVQLPDSTARLLWMRLIANDDWATIGRSFRISASAARRRYQRAQRTMRRLVATELAQLPDTRRELAQRWLRDRTGRQDADPDA